MAYVNNGVIVTYMCTSMETPASTKEKKERKKERERKTAMGHNGTFVLHLSNIG
jgi:hypothetical protein